MTDTLLRALDAAFSALDDAALNPIQRLKISRELAGIRDQIKVGPNAIERLKLARRLAEIRTELGAAAKPAAAAEPAAEGGEPAGEDAAEDIANGLAQRRTTSHLYAFDESRTRGQRQKDNREAEALLKRVEDGEIDGASLTEDQRALLARYSGLGGNLEGADGTKGSGFEYYTPKPVAEAMWALLGELGFAGGKVLDPCAGVGIFGGTAPANAAIDAVELSPVSGKINQLVNDGPGYKTVIAPFEEVAAATPDETHDAVISNVPFGRDVSARGGNELKDTKYQRKVMEFYFIMRSLEKLKPGGLAMFITPPRVVSGRAGQMAELREVASLKAEFLGAYRLPNSIFSGTSADTITDVIVFRKFSREAAAKIAELRQQSPQTLVDANVLWPEFLQGDYFKGEGRRFVLGEFIPGDPDKRHDVDRVVNNGSMQDVLRMIRKFPRSRINWDLLDAAETQPIEYREGDTITQAGETLVLKEGRWERLEGAPQGEVAARATAELQSIYTPLDAVRSGATFADARKTVNDMIDTGKALDVPAWLREAIPQIMLCAAVDRETAWSVGKTAMAVAQVIEERPPKADGFSYRDGYPELSRAMQANAAAASSPPRGMGGRAKAAIKALLVHYNRSRGFSPVWSGELAAGAGVDTRDADTKFDAELYASGGGMFVPMAKARELYGPEWDPMASDDWCVSADGQSVAKASDYYVGNFGEFNARLAAEMRDAPSTAIRDKLARQLAAAEARVQRMDPSRITYSLASPWVTLEEKAEFLRRFVDKRFAVGIGSGQNPKPELIVDIRGSNLTDAEKLLKRMAIHFNGTALGLGGADVANPAKALAGMRDRVARIQSQFNTWARSNPNIAARMDAAVNNPDRLYFESEEDGAPLKIPGLNPQWESHAYQNAWVRKMGREFAGVNGDGVGLGKTSQALIAAQHALSIGTKKLIVFVVPNSVLSNWRKESGRVYASTEDCLYVGLRSDKSGAMKAQPSAYDEDLNKIISGRFRKVFMTAEAFERMRLRESTVDRYDAYLASVDSSYAFSGKGAEDAKTGSLRANLKDQLIGSKAKSMGAPFFEDLGVDGLIFDEAHAYKNSRKTIDTKSAKFLSLAAPSGRGLDAQAKAWYVRSKGRRKDGVILLTATPVTNSPLEIYSMLALAVGDEKLGHLTAGLMGADEFMRAVCVIENQPEMSIDGVTKDYEVFTALQNGAMLRNAIHSIVTARTAEQVGAQIVVPDADERVQKVQLTPAVRSTLETYKEAYRYAVDQMRTNPKGEGSADAFEEVSGKFGEPMELIAHPFNLLLKMTNLIMDPEVDQRATFYAVPQAHREKAGQVIAKWNEKAPVEDRDRPGPHTVEGAIVGSKKKKDGENEVELLRIKVLAKMAGDSVVLDTLDAALQQKFADALEAAGVDWDASIPPKLAALLENFSAEEAHPRGKTGGVATARVRQIIFCDVLAMHTKIKRLLTKRCGVPASAIAVITGSVNGKPEEILEVQDGFNADDENNRYRVIIANEKAEVGINLQKGTQAIHHLTIGWTPDSQTQRNGRGVRQGNETEIVRVYHYDADGSFDMAKRDLVSKKAEWIDGVMAPDADADIIEIAGSITAEQQDRLIRTIGDADAMARFRAETAAEEKNARQAATKTKQVNALSTAVAQSRWLTQFDTLRKFIVEKAVGYAPLLAQIKSLEARIDNPKAKAETVARAQESLAVARANADGLIRQLSEAMGVDAQARINNALARYRGRSDTDADMIRKGLEYTEDWTPVEGSSLDIEFQSERDMAETMRDQARAEFGELAKRDGARRAEVIDKAIAGEAAIIGGRIYASGMLWDGGEWAGVVVKSSRRMEVAAVHTSGRVNTTALSDAINAGTVVAEGEPGFIALAERIASLEDSIEGLSGSAVELLPSRHCAEVGRRRTKLNRIVYESSGYNMPTLPPPQFPFVINPDSVVEGAELASEIARQQAEIIRIVEDRGWQIKFSVPENIPMASRGGMTLGGALASWAQSRGKVVRKIDLQSFGDSYGGTIPMQLKRKGAASAEDFIRDATQTVEQLQSRARAWLADTYSTIVVDEWIGTLDLATDDPAAVMIALGHQTEGAAYRNTVARIQMRIANEQRAAAEAAGRQAEPVAEAVEEKAPDKAAEAALSDPDAYVGIRGDTYRWKDQLKQVSAAGGEQCRWKRDPKPSRDGQWNIRVRHWLSFLEQFPQAAAGLQVVPAEA